MQAAETVQKIQAENRTVALPLRNDTMLGVCTGLGEEFGFNPNWLRVGISALFLVSFKIAIGIYLALGIALAVGRLLFRDKPTNGAVPASRPQSRANDAEAVPDSLAA